MRRSPAASASNPLAEHLGFPEPEASGEAAVGRLVVRPEHTNTVGMIHGGALMALADNTATYAANHANADESGSGPRMITLGLHAEMLSNQRGGEVQAESRIVRAGRRVTVVQTSITGNGGRLLAQVTSTHLSG